MGKSFVIVSICIFCSFLMLAPNSDGVSIGTMIYNQFQTLFNSVDTLGTVARTVSDIVQNIIVKIGNVINKIVSFFGG